MIYIRSSVLYEGLYRTRVSQPVGNCPYNIIIRPSGKQAYYFYKIFPSPETQL